MRPFALTVLLALLSPPAVAQQSAPTDLAEEADLHFKIAVDHYREGDFRAALEHLLLSNRLVPNRNVVFNIARAYEKLEMYEQAYRHYADYVQLETDPGERAAGERALERIAAEVALLRIESEPRGATVFVDRIDLGSRGLTPRTLALPSGPHKVMLQLDGYQLQTVETEVRVGETTTITPDLDKILGVVAVDGPLDGTEVRLGSEDGAVLARLPAELELPPGPHVLVFVAPGFETETRVAEVAADSTTRLVVELAVRTGTVVVDAVERDALIEIDGRAAGFTPAVLEVPVGIHDLRVSQRGFAPFERTVEVEDGGRTAVQVRLRSQQEVTAASRTTQVVEHAPGSVTILTQRELQAFGYVSLFDALAGTRGVFQSNDLTYEYLGFRGFGRPGDYGNRVLVTVDGHAINDDQLGASYVGSDLMTDLDDIQQVEVVRGPGSALYGTNAFFGVINLVTHDGEDIPRPHARLTVDGQRRARARLGAGFGGPGAGGWFSVAGLAGQGADYYFEEFDTPEDGDGFALDADSTFGGTVHARGWVGDVTGQVFFNARTKRIPTGAFETRLGDRRSVSNDYRGFAEVRWDPSFGDRVDLHTRAWLDYYHYYGDFPYERRYVASDRWSGMWAGVEPRMVAQAQPWLRLIAGAEARFYVDANLVSFDSDAGEEDRYLDQKPRQQTYAGYALAEVRGGDVVRAQIGGRYDYFTLRGVGGAFSPRVSVVLRPGPDDVVKLLGGTAFRAPSPYELFYEDDGFTQVRPDSLDPERIATGEVEYTHRFDDVTTLTIATYYNDMGGLIDTELIGIEGQEGELFSYANTDERTRTAGVEYEVRREWRRGIFVAAQHSMQRTRIGSLIDGDPITNSPEHLMALKAAAPMIPGQSTLASRLRLASPRLTTQDTHTDWALLWDLTYTGEFRELSLEYGLGIRNVFDWKYGHPGGFDLRMAEVPQPGRTLFATLKGTL